MDSRSFFSVANETYPLMRRPQSSPPKTSLLADMALLTGDMQLATQRHLAREAALRDWVQTHTILAPEHVTGLMIDSRS